MKKNLIAALLAAFVLTVILAACSQSSDAPAKAIEGYIQALVSKDATRLSSAACKAWEDQAKVELDGFTASTIKTDGMQCQTTGSDGNNKLVTCKGKIVANYNGENQEFPLDGRTYIAAQEDGEWRMCGYK